MVTFCDNPKLRRISKYFSLTSAVRQHRDVSAVGKLPKHRFRTEGRAFCGPSQAVVSAQLGSALRAPFDQGLISTPADAFMIRARPLPMFDAGWRDALVCEQTFKPEHDRLLSAGFNSVQRLVGRFNLGICVLTKHKRENFGNIARAWSMLPEGGTLICVGAKNEGATSVEARINKTLTLTGNLSKGHCRVFWTRVRHEYSPPSDWAEMNSLQSVSGECYWTRPGIFSAGKIDTGSRLLVENLPDKMTGAVADLGAGWGYLSCELLKRFSGIRRIDLFEAELLAIDAAHINLSTVPHPERANVIWRSITELPSAPIYDWVVMNPPFHSGKLTDIDLGQSFLAVASAILRKGGELFAVANQHLPYEKQMRTLFHSIDIVASGHGYKVLRARR